MRPSTRPAPARSALVPWAAYLLTHMATGAPAGYVLVAGPWLLLYVAAPSLLAIAAAPPGRVRVATVAAMTGVAIAAAVLIEVSDDAQAGLAVLWVPTVAVPLAAALGLVRLGAQAFGRSLRPALRSSTISAMRSARTSGRRLVASIQRRYARR